MKKVIYFGFLLCFGLVASAMDPCLEKPRPKLTAKQRRRRNAVCLVSMPNGDNITIVDCGRVVGTISAADLHRRDDVPTWQEIVKQKVDAMPLLLTDKEQ